MKKQVLLVAAICGFSMTQAQDLTNKNGMTILPEAGDIALGFDASPLFSYVGNSFNGSTGNSFNTGWTNNLQTIYGKYYLDASTAVRGWVRLGFGSTTDEVYVTDVTSTATPPAMVTDTRKDSYNAIILGGGIEMRRGHNRLQGYYGGDLIFGIIGNSTEYTYGNSLSTTNTAHTSSFGQTPGMLTDNPGSTFMLGLRGVIGVEYFILPKISLGAEYAWGLGLMNQGEGMSSVEAWNGTAAETTETTTGGSSSFGIDTDMNNMMFGGGSVNLLFHF
jgi:hypothetical protein